MVDAAPLLKLAQLFLDMGMSRPSDQYQSDARPPGDNTETTW